MRPGDRALHVTKSSKYTVLDRFGSGPACDVAKAREVGGLGREVVVRRLREEVRTQVARREEFFRGVEAWSRLSHEGLVTLYDLDRSEDAVIYEVHESSGEQLIRSGGRSAGEVLTWMKQAFGGLGYIHDRGLLHFNIKPSNLLFREGKARLTDGACIDWQATKVLPRPTARQKYLAPEMIDPKIGAVGPATDIYCLSLVFLEFMLAERFDTMFVGAASEAVDVERNWLRWHADLEKRLPSLDDEAGRIPREFAAIIARALEKNPVQRYHTCGELLADLQAVSISEPEAVEKRPAADPGAAPAVRPADNDVASPRIDDIPKKPEAPIVLRWFGCEADLIGANSDHFSVGDDDRADYQLPGPLRLATPVLLRFSRGSEGWRVSPADELPVYVNQTRSVGLTQLRSGDVVRLIPGGPGLQFTIVHQGAEPLAKLATRYAPQLIARDHSSGSSTKAAPAAPQKSRTSAAPAPSRTAAPSAPSAPVPPEIQQERTDDGRSSLAAKMDYRNWDKSTKNWVALAVGLIALTVIVVLLPGGSSDDDSSESISTVDETNATIAPEAGQTDDSEVDGIDHADP